MNSSLSDDPSDERERWDQKYKDSPSSWLEPDPFLERAFSGFVHPLFPDGGTALDFAGGAGRHTIWLAQHGWEVTLMDISEVGVEQARQRAGPLASHIHFVVNDLTRFAASQTQYDLVMAFFYLDREIFPQVLEAIRPGGLLLYKTYTQAQSPLRNGPKDASFLLAEGELLRLANGLQVLHYAEVVADKATAELVARKSY